MIEFKRTDNDTEKIHEFIEGCEKKKKIVDSMDNWLTNSSEIIGKFDNAIADLVEALSDPKHKLNDDTLKAISVLN